MAVKYFEASGKVVSQERTLRLDMKYLYSQHTSASLSFYSFSDLFKIVTNDKVNIDMLDDFQYVEIGNVSKTEDVYAVSLNFNSRNDLTENYYKKIEKGDIIKVRKGDILMSKVRPYLKKIIFIDNDLSKCYFTSAFIDIHPVRMPKVLFYALKKTFIDDINSLSRQGKSYPTLNQSDFVYLKFRKSIIDTLRTNEAEITAQILLIEKKIKQLKTKVLSDEQIINKVFTREFGFDITAFEKQKTIKKFKIKFSDFSNNADLRNSVKFHRPSAEFVLKKLNSISDKKVKNYLAEPIVLGSSITPSQYSENGDYYYISMACIKNWKFEPDNAQLVSNEYSMNNKNKTVFRNDILLARSGEGTIGKTALIEEDCKGIFADFTMRIRLKNINPLFVYYYFRTDFFQYLVEINKKGLGNNTNIFPGQIKEFPMPNVMLRRQREIVNEIKAGLVSQECIKQKIIDERNRIDEIIEKTISKK
jgi:hypothetical protein